MLATRSHKIFRKVLLIDLFETIADSYGGEILHYIRVVTDGAGNVANKGP